MSGTKVSDLPSAQTLGDGDLLYVVNQGNPRKSTLNTLLSYLLTSKGLIKSINGVTTSNGDLYLVKSDIGLDQVPNVNPVKTLNGLNDVLTLSSGSNINVNVLDTSTIQIGVSPNLTIDYSKITGSVSNNIVLATALASVGVQTDPRTIDVNTGNTNLLLSDTLVQWVDADFGLDTELILDEINAPLGAMIEIRQAGIGKINVWANTVRTTVTTPTGTWNQTQGQGTRIQMVSLGGNSWEYK